MHVRSVSEPGAVLSWRRGRATSPAMAPTTFGCAGNDPGFPTEALATQAIGPATAADSRDSLPTARVAVRVDISDKCDRRVVDGERPASRQAAVHALTRRYLAPLRREPTRDAHARDIRKGTGPRVLERARRPAIDESEPRHEAPFAVAQQIADLAAGAVRQPASSRSMILTASRATATNSVVKWSINASGPLRSRSMRTNSGAQSRYGSRKRYHGKFADRACVRKDGGQRFAQLLDARVAGTLRVELRDRTKLLFRDRTRKPFLSMGYTTSLVCPHFQPNANNGRLVGTALCIWPCRAGLGAWRWPTRGRRHPAGVCSRRDDG